MRSLARRDGLSLQTATRESTGLLKWFSVKSSDTKSSTDAGPSGNTSASRLETLDALERSEAGGRPADSDEISALSSSLYPESSSESESTEALPSVQFLRSHISQSFISLNRNLVASSVPSARNGTSNFRGFTTYKKKIRCSASIVLLLSSVRLL